VTGLDRPPETVVADARTGGRDDDTLSPRVNVAVADPTATGDATRTDEGYEGPDAVACGHLAAALAAADTTPGTRVHHGDVRLTSDGPWLVLAPLAGFVATVAKGTATATVTVSLDGDAGAGVGPDLDGVRSALDGVLDSARASHAYYPVGDDEQGVFRTGMTTLSFASAAVDETLRVRFDVSTTPATTRRTIVDRFASLGPDATVAVEFVVGVERAAPSTPLRNAVEDAHRDVVGDAGYEWLPHPTAFSWLPTPEKLAFGGGRPGLRFDSDDFERTRGLLQGVVDRLQEGA
jgi:hypothetical protein